MFGGWLVGWLVGWWLRCRSSSALLVGCTVVQIQRMVTLIFIALHSGERFSDPRKAAETNKETT